MDSGKQTIAQSETWQLYRPTQKNNYINCYYVATSSGRSNHYSSKRGHQAMWYIEQHSLCRGGMDRSCTHQNDLSPNCSKCAAWSVALNFKRWRCTYHDGVSFVCEGLHVQVIYNTYATEERIGPPPSEGNVVCLWSAGSVWKEV